MELWLAFADFVRFFRANHNSKIAGVIGYGRIMAENMTMNRVIHAAVRRDLELVNLRAGGRAGR